MFVPEPHKKIHPSSFQVSSNKPVHNHVQELRVTNSHRAQSNLAQYEYGRLWTNYNFFVASFCKPPMHHFHCCFPTLCGRATLKTAAQEASCLSAKFDCPVT